MDRTTYNDFLNGISNEPLRVIDTAIDRRKYVPIDLSSNNSDLADIDVSSSKAWDVYITDYLEKHDARVAFGGYLEQRDIYSRSSYFKQESAEDERNIHLGVDLWCNSGTKVLAMLDGEIHSFQNNMNFGDYGPTIILKHQIQNIEFYSLYGHLSLASISNLKVGKKVGQGEIMGELGESNVNGDYAPHLHFQLMKDIQEKFGDYPGVASAKELDFYKTNCPNPSLLLKLF